MTGQGQQKLRIKLPNGAEMEVEGTAEFIAEERERFLDSQKREGGTDLDMEAPPRAHETPPQARVPHPIIQPAWDDILETNGGNIQLRAKLRGRGDGLERDASLILLAASSIILRTPKPTAAQLAKWLRASGYPIQRVDRAIQPALDRGDILASGSRRARRYELSAPGAARALRLANELCAFVQPNLPAA